MNKDAILNLQSCDNLAVQLTTIGRWEAERVRKALKLVPTHVSSRYFGIKGTTL